MAASACAGPRGGGSAAAGGDPARPGEAPAPLPEAELALAREAWEAGRGREAAAIAESLAAANRGRPGSGEGAAMWLAGRLWEEVASGLRAAAFEELRGSGDPRALLREGSRRLAAAKLALAEEPGAARALLDLASPEGRDLALLRAATARLSLAEIETLAAGAPADGAAAGVVRAAHARALALAGRTDSAAAVARGVAASAAGEDLALARAVIRGDVSPDTAPLIVGAVLPLTGPLGSVGTWLREGAELAAAALAPGARRVALRVVDDGSSTERAADLVAELERGGATAVLGPVRSEALAAAAAARAYPGLLLVSPTATEVGNALPHAYTLWARSRRESDVARDLGRWLAAELRVFPIGALVPAGAGGEETLGAFRAGVEEGGGAVEIAVGYPPDSTTFETPIAALAAADPAVVFVAADAARTVLQLAPQLAFYGLRTAIVAGGAAWAEPEVVRRLDPRFADGRVVATFADRATPSPEWAGFQRAYEMTYRKALPDNMLPALGHDAMALILRGLPAAGPAPAGAVARAAREGRLTGISGELAVDPATSTVARTTRIGVLRDRALAPAVPADVLAWAEEARRQEEARLEALRRQEEAAGATPAPGTP